MITRLYQPVGSALCGQTCVAMAAGVSLDRAVEIVGHERGTSARELSDALRELGIVTSKRLKRIGKYRVPPKRAILACRKVDRTKRPYRWHWILVWDGEVFDPDGVYPQGFGTSWEYTSYLEIYS